MRTKPFPWKCPSCREQAVYPATVDYTTTIEHDGRSYDVKIPALDVPRCQKCGKLVLVDSANREISRAFRREARLLAPEQISQNRKALGLTQKDFANLLSVGEATVSRWETGAQIQQRSLDRLMRIFFGFEEVREILADEDRIAELGITVSAIQTTSTLAFSGLVIMLESRVSAGESAEFVRAIDITDATADFPESSDLKNSAYTALSRDRVALVGRN